MISRCFEAYWIYSLAKCKNICNFSINASRANSSALKFYMREMFFDPDKFKILLYYESVIEKI